MSTIVRSVTVADFDSAVLNADTPVLVDFWAPWCGPCKTMMPLVDDLAESYAGNVTIVAVDVEANPEVAAKYGARTIPLFVLFEGGAQKARVSGAMSQTRLCHFIDTNLGAR